MFAFSNAYSAIMPAFSIPAGVSLPMAIAKEDAPNIVRDNPVYRVGIGAMECFHEAVNSASLAKQDAWELCSRAQNAGPVKCYQDAYSTTGLSSRQAVELCKTALNAGPSSCFKGAYNTTVLSVNEASGLCRGYGTTGTAQCYKEAFAGGISSGKSLRLCSGAVDNSPAQCVMETSQNLPERESMRQCRAYQKYN